LTPRIISYTLRIALSHRPASGRGLIGLPLRELPNHQADQFALPKKLPKFPDRATTQFQAAPENRIKG
jgi:hypothetical protein